MAKPQHRTPEYRAARKQLDKAQARGEWLTCVQPVCKHPTRDIAPHQPIDVAHDDGGAVILGPAHEHCNRSDGGKRRHMDTKGRRWIL